MSFKDFRNNERRTELGQERRERLNEMSGLIREATRANIHQLLELPDVIRVKWIDADSNHRVMLKERMTRYLLSEKCTEENRRLIKLLIDKIDEVDRISGEIDALKAEGGGGNDSDRPAPLSERDSEPVREPSEPAPDLAS